MDLGLDRPRCALHKPLLALLLGLGRVEGHRGFVHCDDPVQRRHGVAAEQRQEGPTGPHPLVFRVLA
jgi:hypothetical protein